MMRDVFHEQIVVKEKTAVDYIIQIGIIFVTVLLIYLAIFVLPNIGIISTIVPLAAVGFGYGGYQLLIHRNIEYEYIITNGEIDIDKITNKNKRKRLITFQAKKVTKIGFYDKTKHDKQGYGKTYDFAVDTKDSKKTIYMDYNSKDNGKVQILISPNDDILNAIVKFLPAPLRIEFQRELEYNGQK